MRLERLMVGHLEAPHTDSAMIELQNVSKYYGHLKAVVLLRPRIWTDPFAPERHEKEMQVSGRHSLPDREAESFIIWRNRMEPMSADPIIPAITDFPVNLEKFYAE